MLTAWRELNSCRAIGMAVGPIPWTAIIAWARYYGFDHDRTQQLIGVVRHCESVQAKRAKDDADLKATGLRKRR